MFDPGLGFLKIRTADIYDISIVGIAQELGAGERTNERDFGLGCDRLTGLLSRHPDGTRLPYGTRPPYGRDKDLLVLDLPPGTGDVQLTMVQKHKPAGAVIVSTPQDLALIDARRAIDLFQRMGVPVIGLIENMAGYACPHCGEVSDPFGRGGAEAAAETLGIPFLGRVPLEMTIRAASDAGEPPAAGNGPEAELFAKLADEVISLPMHAYLDAPTQERIISAVRRAVSN